jgi:hypothetical protein
MPYTVPGNERDALAKPDATVHSCPEKATLLSAYTRAAKEYGDTVTELNEQMGVVPRAEWLRRHQAADALRQSVESAKLVLENHVAAHGC